MTNCEYLPWKQVVLRKKHFDPCFFQQCFFFFKQNTFFFFKKTLPQYDPLWHSDQLLANISLFKNKSLFLFEIRKVIYYFTTDIYITFSWSSSFYEYAKCLVCLIEMTSGQKIYYFRIVKLSIFWGGCLPWPSHSLKWSEHLNKNVSALWQ